MTTQNNTNHGGAGFVSLLTILFIGLKLTGYIDWSWWWVLSPLWIAPIIIILMILIVVFVKSLID